MGRHWIRCRLLMLLLPAVLVVGCVSSSIIWTGHHSFPGLKWTPEESVVFLPDSLSLRDSTVRATTGVISLRYSAGTNLENLPIVVEIESPTEGIYRCDTIVERLLPVDDRTPHKGRMGIFESTDTIRLHSAVSPGWSISFCPACEEVIDGIISLTFDIIK